MRIAYLSPLVESVPPALYGGTERVISWLTEEMVRRGHEVTLFASGDSRTSARLVPGAPRALRRAGVRDPLPATLSMLGEAFARARDFDLIHSHVDWLAFPFERAVESKVVHTLHGRLDLPLVAEAFERHRGALLVSISASQRAPLPRTRFLATVHHGLPRDLYRFSPRAQDYVLFLGRLSVEKGPTLAIRAAKQAGVRLVIAAKVDPADNAYFESEVRPLLDDPSIEYVGEVNDAEKQELIGNARALLAPIDWPEPFGLVFIEALACGTPVVTRACGSAPELIEHGTTGWVVSSVEELARAIGAVERLDRRVCRAEFERRFSVERMTSDYEELYARVLRSDEPLPCAGAVA